MEQTCQPVQKKWFDRVPPVLWVLSIIIIWFAVASRGSFFTIPNFLNIAVQGSVLLILSLGATCVILTEGIDLSLGSILTLGGVIAVLAMYRGVPAIPAMLAGVASGFLCGAITGLLIARGRLPPFIATLGMSGLAAGAAVVMTNASSIYADPPAFVFFGSGRLFGVVPMPIVVAALTFGVVYVILYHTPFGHYIFSLGGNEAGAALSGVNTVLWKFMTYLMAGGLGGVAGVLMASRLHAAEPTIGLRWEFDAIAATIIGGTSFEKGRGGIRGTVLGVLLLAVMRNGLNVIGIRPVYQAVILGAVLIIAIIFDVLMKKRQEGL
jgi:ribose/xylose/arabinose/galactoside ABC-type transport system permease subunit